MPHAVFLTGASGFMGRRLAAELLRRGHRVRGLVRPGSESRAAEGCEIVCADPLDSASYRSRVAGCDTLVQLVGVAHPSPAKAAQFRSIDLVSAKAAVEAAASSRRTSAAVKSPLRGSQPINSPSAIPLIRRNTPASSRCVHILSSR